MKPQKFRIAAWAAVIAAVAFVAEIALSLLAETPAYGAAVKPTAVVFALAVHVSAGSYAMWRLREYLHEICDFHGVDTLILWLIGGGILLAAVTVVARLSLSHSLTGVVLPVVIGLPVGALSMLFGYRLLRANGTLGGYKKAFAYTHMAAPPFFLTVLLAPVGLLLLLAGQALLALILFAEDRVELEFV